MDNEVNALVVNVQSLVEVVVLGYSMEGIFGIFEECQEIEQNYCELACYRRGDATTSFHLQTVCRSVLLISCQTSFKL